MPRGLRNWTHRQVTRFLRKNGFFRSPYPRRGSHMCWEHKDDRERIISIHYIHSGKVYRPKSMSIFIKKSGISKEIWLNSRKIR